MEGANGIINTFLIQALDHRMVQVWRLRDEAALIEGIEGRAIHGQSRPVIPVLHLNCNRTIDLRSNSGS
jgi:hypothetical protein